MAVSVFDLFKIGIGPSQLAHGRADARGAHVRARAASTTALLDRVARVKAELYGSLGATGKGHGSDKAVLLGLGARARHGRRRRHPRRSDGDPIRRPAAARSGRREVAVRRTRRPRLPPPARRCPFHANGMRFTALRRGRRGAGRAHATTRWAAASSSATRWRPTATRRRRHRPPTDRAAASVPQRRPSCSSSPRARGHDHRRASCGATSATGGRRGDRRRPAAHLAGDAGVRRARLRTRGHAAGRLQGAAPRRRR